MANLEENIFDYALGLALHDAIKQSGGIESGMWIVDTQSKLRSAAQLHALSFYRALPLTWFVLQHFSTHERFGRGWQTPPNQASSSVDRVRAIASGDPAAIGALISDLGDEARKADLTPEAYKVLPATTVTIRFRIGPRDGIDLPMEVDRDD